MSSTLPPGPEDGDCVSRCGVYVENGPPVPILSGAGLYVEDGDHNEVFLMTRAEVTLVTKDTTDFEHVLLNATYLYDGVVQVFQDGGKPVYTLRFTYRHFSVYTCFYSSNSGGTSPCSKLH